MRSGLGDHLGGGVLEDADELAADDLALLFRVGDAGERIEKAPLGVDDLQPDARRRHEVLLDLLGLARAEQTVVDEHAGELFADRTLHECGGNRRVDASGESTDRQLVADLVTDRLDLLVDDVAHRPGRTTPGDLEQEVLEHLLPVLRSASPRGGTARPASCRSSVLERGNRRALAHRRDHEPVRSGW